MSEQQLVLMRMPLGPLGTNCYVIGDKAVGEAFIIDPATPEVLDALKKHDLKPKAILLTHGHGDHIGGVQDIVDAYQVPVYIHKGDVPYLADPELNLSAYSNPTPIKVNAVSSRLNKVTILHVALLTLKYLKRQGHTPGGVCYYMEGLVFVGDTLFRDSVGRTDFPNGSYETLMESIKNSAL